MRKLTIEGWFFRGRCGLAVSLQSIKGARAKGMQMVNLVTLEPLLQRTVMLTFLYGENFYTHGVVNAKM